MSEYDCGKQFVNHLVFTCRGLLAQTLFCLEALRFSVIVKNYFPNRLSILLHFYFSLSKVLNLLSNGKQASVNAKSC